MSRCFKGQEHGRIVAALADRRKSLGLTQTDVDEIAGFASGQVAKWESGAKLVSIEFASLYAKALGCKLTILPMI